MAIQAAPTVRESLEQAVETVTPEEVTTPVPVAEAVSETTAAPATPAPEETEAQKAERLRDEKTGQFVKGKPAQKEPEVQAAAPAATPAKPKVPMPTSWKKELAPQWEAMPPEAQAYWSEREKQYQTGVSTYKAEADGARTIKQALAKYEPMLQKKGIATDKWIDQMGIAHYLISEGSSQERVQAVAQIIKQNGIDVNALGQLLAGQQPVYQQPQAQSSLPQAPVDIGALVEEKLQAKEIEAAYKSFEKDVSEGKYPHFADEAVKGSMAGLLQAGLAQDYPSAYEAALALPQHRHLAAPAQAIAPAVPDQAAAKQAQAQRARSQAVSVKSSTPSAMTQTQGPQSLREQLSESFDKATASRV